MLQFEQQLQRLNDAKPQLDLLYNALAIDSLRKQLLELEEKAAEEGFWEDIKAGQVVLQKTRQTKSKLEQYDKLCQFYQDTLTLIDIALEMEDESVFKEVLDAVDTILSDIQTIRLTALLTGEYDSKNAILTFHAGAGGTEAQDWVEMLYRMYTRWAERHGYKYKILDYLDGEEAGIKSASILIEGSNVYGFLRSEAGVHRLVRISPFDSSGRRHTSFASLEVMPEIDEDTDIAISDTDLRIDTYRSGGAGGQHVNKTDSAVRITHLPTGVVSACQNERSQHQNKDVAMKMLKAKLAAIKEREHLEKIDDIKGEQKEIGWGSQIRSYVFMPYTLAKDHRTGCEVGNVSAVMDGEIDAFINAYLILKTTAKL